MKKVFIFDLDDTLIWTNFAYGLAFIKLYFFLMKIWKRRVPSYGPLARWLEDASVALAREINPGTGRCFGFDMERFPTAFVRCYEKLCQQGFGEYESKTAEKIYRIGLSAFDIQTYRKGGLVPGAKSVLNFLHQKKDILILMTKGDPRVQANKIKALKLKRWFSEVHVVDRKTAEHFAQFRKRFPENQIFSVGNVFAADIKPAFDAGIKGILIPCYTWEGEQKSRKDTSLAEAFVVPSIRDIVKLYREGKLNQDGEGH